MVCDDGGASTLLPEVGAFLLLLETPELQKLVLAVRSEVRILKSLCMSRMYRCCNNCEMVR